MFRFAINVSSPPFPGRNPRGLYPGGLPKDLKRTSKRLIEDLQKTSTYPKRLIEKTFTFSKTLIEDLQKTSTFPKRLTEKKKTNALASFDPR
jgi:hypothetical protein